VKYAERHYESKDGLKLFFRDYGPAEGPAAPVVCLPGLTRNSRDFTFLARHLASERRVVCPDLRGRGYSQWDDDYRNYNPAIYVEDVIQLIESERLSKTVLIGTSLGGFIAMIIGATRPDLVSAVVSNDAGPEVDPNGLARISQYAGAQGPAPSWAEAAKVCRNNYGDAFPGLSNEDWMEFAHQTYRAGDDGVIRLDVDPRVGDAVRELDSTPADLWPLFSMLKDMPMLVIRGARSDILSETTIAKMVKVKRDLKTATIPDRGHAPLLNEIESLVALDSFLDGLGEKAVNPALSRERA